MKSTKKLALSFVLALLPSMLFAQAFKVTPLNNLVIDGTTMVPSYVVSVEDVTSDSSALMTPNLPGKDRQLQGKIPPAVANRVALYWTFDGWFLVPRDWRLARAQVGVDNSSVYEFQPPNDDSGMIAVRDSGGACVGCALSLASPFFPEAKRESERLYGAMDTGIAAPIRMVELGKHTVAYSRRDDEGQDSDGIAYYTADGGYEAFTYEVSLPPDEHVLATAILDWRLPPRDQR